MVGHTLSVYARLAWVAEQRRKPHQRDKFLLLAACAAAELQRWELVESWGCQILEHNAHHLIGRYASLRSALHEPEFQTYVRQLRRRWPFEKAEYLLTRSDLTSRPIPDNDEELFAKLRGAARPVQDSTEAQRDQVPATPWFGLMKGLLASQKNQEKPRAILAGNGDVRPQNANGVASSAEPARQPSLSDAAERVTVQLAGLGQTRAVAGKRSSSWAVWLLLMGVVLGGLAVLAWSVVAAIV